MGLLAKYPGRAWAAAPAVLVAAFAGTATAQSLDACRQMQDPQARLACYDRLGPATALPPAESPRVGGIRPTAPSGTYAVPPAVASPEQKFGAENVRQPAGVAAPRPQEIEALTAQVASVRQAGMGRIAVTLSNGQVWRQTETVRLDLSAGDTVTIERGALGSYNLLTSRTSRLYKVERTQ
ncbi:hypothetical protein [Rhodospirillum centenum]|uniref:Type IV pilus biogenesis protein PilP n=1 Tax=Rhodospirillum centenum (strain ATCC 51521 / SW) TaxID=414684 RepID=B6IXQ4_RHOCS|nr:hypothetical protein [Rhodospirillum centenum]ACJ01078.1 conserved hypothetical protein [Rhodospirillum centenum SW]